MTLKRRSNESEITLTRPSNDPQTTLRRPSNDPPTTSKRPSNDPETALKRASNTRKQSTKPTYTNNYLKRRSDIAQSALTRPLYTLRPSPCPAHPDSRSGYRSACLRPWTSSAPNFSQGAPGFTGALLPLRSSPIRASGPFGVLKALGLSAPNLPAIFGLLRLHLHTFSTSFSLLRIICVGASFFSLCTSVSLCLSLSLFLFLFHMQSLLRALLSLSRASFFEVDETMRTLKL